MATQRQLSNTTYASILSGPKEQEEMNKMLKHLKTSSASASMTTASTSATTATKKAGLERVDSGVEMNVKPEQWRLNTPRVSQKHHNAASIIQTAFRAFKSKRTKQQQQAAAHIQASFKSFLTRKQLLASLHGKIQDLENELHDKDAKLATTETELQLRKDMIDSLGKNIASLRKQVADKSNSSSTDQNKQLLTEVAELKALQSAKDKEIHDLRTQLIEVRRSLESQQSSWMNTPTYSSSSLTASTSASSLSLPPAPTSASSSSSSSSATLSNTSTSASNNTTATTTTKNTNNTITPPRPTSEQLHDEDIPASVTAASVVQSLWSTQQITDDPSSSSNSATSQLWTANGASRESIFAIPSSTSTSTLESTQRNLLGSTSSQSVDMLVMNSYGSSSNLLMGMNPLVDSTSRFGNLSSMSTSGRGLSLDMMDMHQDPIFNTSTSAFSTPFDSTNGAQFGMMKPVTNQAANAAASMTNTHALNYDANTRANYHFLVEKIVKTNDQPASLLLQQKLKTSSDSPEIRDMIFEAILTQAIPLMKNRFGNFLMQKAFETASAQQALLLGQIMRGNIYHLACDRFACHVVQKALEVVPEELKATLITELFRAIPETITHKFACHVWQRVYETKWSPNFPNPPAIMHYVDSSLKGQWAQIANDENGSLVVQCVFEHCKDQEKSPIMGEILAHTVDISKGQWGNWVIQHILEHGSTSDKSYVLSVVTKHMYTMSVDQYASKVVEKALKTAATKTDLASVVDAALAMGEMGRPIVLDMMNNQYANYVVQHILNLAESPQKEALLRIMAPHVPILKGSKYGQRVAAIVEKLIKGHHGYRF